MNIINIKETDPKSIIGNSLTFYDGLATENEIIEFINEIPQEINKLEFHKSSVLPSNLGKIKRLDILTIHNNDNDTIAKEILNIPIERLNIRICTQEFLSIDFFQNNGVRRLFINGNFRRLPEGDYNMPNLEYLYLRSQIFSEIPEGNHSLPALKSFHAPSSKLSNIPNSFFSDSKLEELNITSRFLNQLPDSLSQCKELTTLSIFAPLQKGIPSLEKTSLRNFSITHAAGEEYESCQLPKTIETIYFHAGLLTNSFPDLSRCENLSSLTLLRGKKYPQFAKNLTKLDKIEFTNILADKFPVELDTATNLSSIRLIRCPIEGFPNFLLDCASLNKLQFNNIQSAEIPLDWKSCINLDTLVVEARNLKVASIDFVKKFKKLKHLTSLKPPVTRVRRELQLLRVPQSSVF